MIKTGFQKINVKYIKKDLQYNLLLTLVSRSFKLIKSEKTNKVNGLKKDFKFKNVHMRVLDESEKCHIGCFYQF